MLDGAPRDPRTRWLLTATVQMRVLPTSSPAYPRRSSTNHRYDRPFNGRRDAIIMYRFRSRLLVLSMYRGYRSRVNRTGNEFSVLEKRRKQSIGRAQMAQPDESSYGHAHHVRVSLSGLLALPRSFARTIRWPVYYFIACRKCH